jgi:hypothetical protein
VSRLVWRRRSLGSRRLGYANESFTAALWACSYSSRDSRRIANSGLGQREERGGVVVWVGSWVGLALGWDSARGEKGAMVRVRGKGSGTGHGCDEGRSMGNVVDRPMGMPRKEDRQRRTAHGAHGHGQAQA